MTMTKGKRNDIAIVFEDEDIIIVNKPSGLLTMSTGKEDEVTAYTLLTDYVKRKNLRSRIFIVHRLDRDTSGLLIFAKTPDTKYALQDYWEEAVLERRYVAVTERVPSPESGRVVSWLKENKKSFIVSSSPTDNGGQKAITNYKVLKSNGKNALVEFELETGRKNQIRVHASSVLGTPVAGDRKYGASSSPINRLALHAESIKFKHPWTGEILSFTTGIPKSFLSLF